MEKPYYSLSDYYKKTFGKKVYKVALDGGFSCPNRDGTLSRQGCIFCSGDGSGSFIGHRNQWTSQASSYKIRDKDTIKSCSNLEEQLTRGIQRLSLKIGPEGLFIAYFQSFTNTYGPVEKLKSQMDLVLSHPQVVGISIATRPDCLEDDMLDLLENYNQLTDLTIELGLQTIHAKTAKYINRCYPLSTYDNAIIALKKRNIKVVTHMIIGLPKESPEMVIETAKYIAASNTHGIKIHLLHILKNTQLASSYEENPFHILSMDEYINLLISTIQVLPTDMVIHRITGDGPKSQLIAPLWSGNKRNVLNTIHRKFKESGSYQGQLFQLNK